MVSKVLVINEIPEHLRIKSYFYKHEDKEKGKLNTTQ